MVKYAYGCLSLITPEPALPRRRRVVNADGSAESARIQAVDRRRTVRIVGFGTGRMKWRAEGPAKRVTDRAERKERNSSGLHRCGVAEIVRPAYFGAALRSAAEYPRTASRTLIAAAGHPCSKTRMSSARASDPRRSCRREQSDIGENRDDQGNAQRDCSCGACRASSRDRLHFQSRTGSTAQKSLILFR